MTVQITEQGIAALDEYARVRIAFTVDRVLDVTTCDDGRSGFALCERRLQVPYSKDYDAIRGEAPLQWSSRFDLSDWSFFVARLANDIVGGAAVARDAPGLTTRERRRDVAVLWDIRVCEDDRRRGVGRALFERVEEWARSRQCRQLEIETQNTNVGACRFYERQGCTLRAIARGAYPEFPDEVQLLWYKDLQV